jgi:hypothetical protein
MDAPIVNNAARPIRRAACVATLLIALTPGALFAQGKTVVRESDPEERRSALIALWDAQPGSTDARSGMTYQTWLAAQAGESSAMLRTTIPVPTPGRWASVGPRGF